MLLLYFQLIQNSNNRHSGWTIISRGDNVELALERLSYLKYSNSGNGAVNADFHFMYGYRLLLYGT